MSAKHLTLGSGEIQLTQYDWDHPTSDVSISDGYFLHMSLTPRRGSAHATYIDRDRGVSRKIGRVMFIPPGRMLHSRSDSGRQRSLQCSLRPQVVEDFLAREPNLGDAILAEGLDLNRPEIDAVMMKILDELCNPGFAQDAMVELLLNTLAITLVRTLRLNLKETAPIHGGLAPWRMRLIRERVFADEPAPHLGELAQLCNMSVRHLTRAFRAEADMTIASFVEHAMVDRARRLLGNSDQPITEIATRLGFASPSSFTYAFRRATGALPSEFRRRFSAASPVAQHPS